MRNLVYGVEEPTAGINYIGSQADNQRPMQYAIKCRITSGCGIAASCFAGVVSPRP